MTSRGSTSALTFLTPEQPDSPRPTLISALAFTCLLYRCSSSSPPSRCGEDDGFIGATCVFHLSYNAPSSVERDEMSQTASSRSLPGLHHWRRRLNVLIVSFQRLSVNTLPVSLLSVSECSVSQKYESWLRVRQKGRKVSEDTQSLHPHWPHICFREA